MDKDYTIFLEHILESIEYIEEYIKNVSKEELSSNVQLQDSVYRRIEVIGEATRNLPDNIKQANSHIPWRDIVDMRNVLIHEYFGIDIDLVWKALKEDLPNFKKDIIALLNV